MSSSRRDKLLYDEHNRRSTRVFFFELDLEKPKYVLKVNIFLQVLHTIVVLTETFTSHGAINLKHSDYAKELVSHYI